MDSLLATAASKFGVTEDALLEIEETVSQHLRKRALQLASEECWEDRRLVLYEEREGNRISHCVTPDNLAREFGFALRPLICGAGELYVEMLTKAIMEHRRQRQPVRWESIAYRAMQFCHAQLDWELSAEWLARAFKTAGLTQKCYWTPCAKVAFLCSFSMWPAVWRDWEEKEPLTSFFEIALRKIAHIVRLAPEKTAGTTFNLPTIQEFRRMGIITQKEAAEWLHCTARTIRTYIRKGELSKSKTGKVCCDDKWARKIRKEYGPSARVM